MAKRSKNLSLGEDAIRRGERYSELHDTSVSQLVEDFLSSLPTEDELPDPLSPGVRRLLGIASDEGGREAFRSYLARKYGA